MAAVTGKKKAKMRYKMLFTTLKVILRTKKFRGMFCPKKKKKKKCKALSYLDKKKSIFQKRKQLKSMHSVCQHSVRCEIQFLQFLTAPVAFHRM